MYFDKYYSLVEENRVLLFDNGSIYQLIKMEKMYYLKSLTNGFPLIKASMITINHCFSSARLI